MKRYLKLYFDTFCLLAFTYGLVNLIVNPLTFKHEVINDGIQLRDTVSIDYLWAYGFIFFVTFIVFLIMLLLIKLKESKGGKKK